MVQQLLLALALAGLTVVVHAFGTIRCVMPLSGVWFPRRDNRRPSRQMLTLILLVCGLLVLHLLEMGLWAVGYTIAGVKEDFESALYYSLESYTTVGYGNATPHPSWQLVGPIESAAGILMLGVSTAIIVAAVQRLFVDLERK